MQKDISLSSYKRILLELDLSNLVGFVQQSGKNLPGLVKTPCLPYFLEVFQR